MYSYSRATTAHTWAVQHSRELYTVSTVDNCTAQSRAVLPVHYYMIYIIILIYLNGGIEMRVSTVSWLDAPADFQVEGQPIIGKRMASEHECIIITL